MGYPVFYVPAGDVLPVMFASYDGGTGASITLTGLAVTDIEIYKDGSTTQRSSDAGYTLLDTDGIDFDGLTGIHGFSIDTGDNTDASFYTVGAWFTVVVSAVTIDAQTVSFIACQFRIMKAESVAGVPKGDVDAWLGTAAATPTVAGVPEVDVTHWLGTAAATPTVAGVPEVDLTHVGGATTNVAALATNVDAILTDTGTTLQAELDGIQADTEDIQARLPAALTGAGNIKADALAVNGSTTAAARLALSGATILPGTVDNTGHTPTTTEFEADDITEATADHFIGRVIIFTSGALQYQATDITDYALATGRGHFTVTALTEAPANNDTFIIV